MNDDTPIRLLIDVPLDGPTNMARDEALLRCVERGESPSTLRFYQWDPPTISLGYFQKYADYAALPEPAGKLAVVRRTTGGGAILHDREWTYSLVMPLTQPLLRQGTSRLYEIMHDALIDVLAQSRIIAERCGISDDSAAHRGPFFCFQRRHCLDVLLDGEKLAGSAQRRTQLAVLQHGSVMLENRYAQQKTAFIPHAALLHETDLLEPLVQSLATRLECSIAAGPWSEAELNEANLLNQKYRSDAWTQRQ